MRCIKQWLKVLVLLALLAAAGVACHRAKSVVVDPEHVKLEQKGATETLKATFLDPIGRPVRPNSPVTWRSSDENVATVVSGVVTAADTGVAQITVASGELAASMEVVVRVPGAIVITPPEVHIREREKTVLDVKLLDTAGNEIRHKKLDWHAEGGIDVSDMSGELSASKAGPASVTVRLGDLNATVPVVVTEGEKIVVKHWYKHFPPTPEEALHYFHTQTDFCSCNVTCPLVIAGSPICPSLIEEIKRPDRHLRSEEIETIGYLRCRDGLPALRTILENEREQEEFRSSALRAIWLMGGQPAESFLASLAKHPGPYRKAAQDLKKQSNKEYRKIEDEIMGCGPE
jgi:hypothetical protein